MLVELGLWYPKSTSESASLMQFDCSGLCRAKYLKDVKLHKKIVELQYTQVPERHKNRCAKLIQ